MVILGINTAFKNPSVVLVHENSNKEISLGNEQHQTENLIPSISGLLKEFGLATTDLTHIVVVSGPGSFTALRIGIITANTLAQNLQIPLYAITSFKYLKLSAKNGSPLVLVHAGGDSVYTERGEIISFEKFLDEYNGEPVIADLSFEQIEKHSKKINFVEDKIDFKTIASLVVTKQEYQIPDLPLAPNYIKLPNISEPKL